MKIIALEKELPGSQEEDYIKFSEEEARKAWAMHMGGFIRELYFRADKKCAVLILECESINRAYEKLKDLPFVREKLIDFELIPLRAYDGFERLFKK